MLAAPHCSCRIQVLHLRKNPGWNHGTVNFRFSISCTKNPFQTGYKGRMLHSPNLLEVRILPWMQPWYKPTWAGREPPWLYGNPLASTVQSWNSPLLTQKNSKHAGGIHDCRAALSHLFFSHVLWTSPSAMARGGNGEGMDSDVLIQARYTHTHIYS